MFSTPLSTHRVRILGCAQPPSWFVCRSVLCPSQSDALGGHPAGPNSIHLWGCRKGKTVSQWGGGAGAQDAVAILPLSGTGCVGAPPA